MHITLSLKSEWLFSLYIAVVNIYKPLRNGNCDIIIVQYSDVIIWNPDFPVPFRLPIQCYAGAVVYVVWERGKARLFGWKGMGVNGSMTLEKIIIQLNPANSNSVVSNSPLFWTQNHFPWMFPSVICSRLSRTPVISNTIFRFPCEVEKPGFNCNFIVVECVSLIVVLILLYVALLRAGSSADVWNRRWWRRCHAQATENGHERQVDSEVFDSNFWFEVAFT